MLYVEQLRVPERLLGKMALLNAPGASGPRYASFFGDANVVVVRLLKGTGADVMPEVVIEIPQEIVEAFVAEDVAAELTR